MKDIISRTAAFAAAVIISCQACPVHAQDSGYVNGGYQAQEQPGDSGIWDLESCISYALGHNSEIQERLLDIQGGELSVNTARMSRLPDLSASIGSNIYFGRSPSRDASYIDNSQISGSIGISTSVPVYQGMRIRHEIDKAKVDFLAATHNLELARKNTALNITSLFLQAMFDKEMVAIAESQLQISSSQLELSRGQYESGRVSRSDVIRNESLVAADEATLTQNRNSLILSTLTLKQAMNLPDSIDFTPAMSPEVSILPRIEDIPSLSQICDGSMKTHPSILYATASLESSMAALKSARSAFQPSIYLSAGYGNSVYSNLTDRSLNSDFWTQMRHNGNEYIGLSLSIPIFSRNTTRNNVRMSQINVSRQELMLSESKKALRKEIEQAYYGAVAAYSSMVSAQKALDAAELAFENEKDKLNSGKSGIYDYANAKAEVEKAQATLAHSRYDYILRYRILEFYMD